MTDHTSIIKIAWKDYELNIEVGIFLKIMFLLKIWLKVIVVTNIYNFEKIYSNIESELLIKNRINLIFNLYNLFLKIDLYLLLFINIFKFKINSIN